ncbi:MAG TPA: type II secretion system protein M [Woeseiaceae bacterium]|nr:type II secretion system protein M [Woeseiaceae bacterium]
MKNWFSGLEKREQLFVGIGAVVVSLIVVWALVWMPLDKYQRNLQASVAVWEKSLGELRVLAPNLAAAGASTGTEPGVVSDDSPMVVVDQTLRERSLNSAVKRRQPTPNGIRVEFENVAFDQLVVWLGDLNRTHGMEVQAGNLSLASRSEPGRINASLTLERTP